MSDGSLPSIKEIEANLGEFDFEGKTRRKLILLEGYPNMAKTITLRIKARTDANISVELLRWALRYYQGRRPPHLHPSQWDGARPRCCGTRLKITHENR